MFFFHPEAVEIPSDVEWYHETHWNSIEILQDYPKSRDCSTSILCCTTSGSTTALVLRIFKDSAKLEAHGCFERLFDQGESQTVGVEHESFSLLEKDETPSSSKFHERVPSSSSSSSSSSLLCWWRIKFHDFLVIFTLTRLNSTASRRSCSAGPSPWWIERMHLWSARSCGEKTWRSRRSPRQFEMVGC